MKVCFILEGCYPYVRGGVSAWAHQYMSSSPDIEFVLWTVHASPVDIATPLYTLPANVVEHHHVYLTKPVSKRHTRIKPALQRQAIDAIRAILHHQEDAWEQLMDCIQILKNNADDLTASPLFLDLAREISDQTPGLGLADAFYGLCSMFQPVQNILSATIPEADIYHSAVAGYGGLLASLAAHKTGKPMILTEHGIYPREREEELLSSNWTVPGMLMCWTQFFYDMSLCAYNHAFRVTSLFAGAMERQISIGCPREKCVVIPNGIRNEDFSGISLPASSSTIHIGAFVRFAAIKDIKTMIHSFALLHARYPQTLLHLMGGTDDESYRASCIALIHRLHLENAILVEGHVDAVRMMQRMDITLLTSISEGQPLTLLESMAAGRPCVATRVGNCEGLLATPIDGIGPAGICCTPMSPQEIADALAKLCNNTELRASMGRCGQLRVSSKYTLPRMLNDYHQLYQEVSDSGRNRL